MRTYIIETTDGDTFPVSAPCKSEALKLARAMDARIIAYIDDRPVQASLPTVRALMFDADRFGGARPSHAPQWEA